MSPDELQLSAALLSAKPRLPAATPMDAAAAGKAAEEFEAVFIAEVLSPMFEGIRTDGPFGGGPGEAIFRSLLVEHYAKAMARRGGFGLAEAVKREILRSQEVAR